MPGFWSKMYGTPILFSAMHLVSSILHEVGNFEWVKYGAWTVNRKVLFICSNRPGFKS